MSAASSPDRTPDALATAPLPPADDGLADRAWVVVAWALLGVAVLVVGVGVLVLLDLAMGGAP